MQRRRHGDESRREHRGDGKASRGRKINRRRRRRKRRRRGGKTGSLTGSRIDDCDVSSDWKREKEDEIMRRGR